MVSSPSLRQISECFIKPKMKTGKDIVHLSSSEIALMSAQYMQKGVLFPKPKTPIESFLDKLKHSLSVTLVHFYSLAGRFETRFDEENRTSTIFIDCNKGPGARFVHASLDLTVSDILSEAYRSEATYSMFDHNEAFNYDGHTVSLMTVQVTELRDGVFIACSMNHACSDGSSFCSFFNSFSEIFMADGDETTPISQPPVYVNPWFLDGPGPINLPFTEPPEELMVRYEGAQLKERVFHFRASSVAKLKAKANLDCLTTTTTMNSQVSSFQALAAFAWRCITRARSPPEDETTSCRVPMDCRGKLSPPLPQYYFGCLVDSNAVVATTRDIMEKSLGWVAMLLNQTIRSHGDKNVRATAEEWLQKPRFHPFTGKPNAYSVMCGSSMRFDMYRCEFGMGKALAIIEGKRGSFDGKVTCWPGRDGQGSADMFVRLNARSMAALERDAEFLDAVSLFLSV